MKIILAPNSFKGSLDAWSAAEAMQKGFASSDLKPDCLLFPIADGGDHTVKVMNRKFGGTLVKEKVLDPLGRETEAVWSLIRGGTTAVIEMAGASGLALLKPGEPDPWAANTFGTGQLILSALNAGVKEIILGIGGSATVDGGLGMLMALGMKLSDGRGKEVGRKGNPLLHVEDLDPSGMDPRLKNVGIKVMCDVDNPLTGPDGAARVFGPQKGASAKDVEKLERLLERYNDLLKRVTGRDYSEMPCGGAAGGISVSLKAFLNAGLVNGTDYLLEIMGFDDALEGAGMVVTAEGRADSQTLSGKGPAGVARKAAGKGVPVVLLAGQIEAVERLNSIFNAVFPIVNGISTLEEAIGNTAADLERTCCQLGNLMAAVKRGKAF